LSPGSKGGGGGFVRGLLVGVVAAVLLLALVTPLREAVLPDSDGDRVTEALEVIDRDYFREADLAALEDASIDGIVRRLRRENDDRFSHYFDPETYDRFQASTSGEFSGVGMTVSEVKRGLRVARVFEDTPAERAGIGVGDVIVAVEGKSIAGEDSEEASARIKGPPGTEVEITVRDAETGKERDIRVERATVRIPAVDGQMERCEDGTKVAFVQLASFTSGAHGELRNEIERLYRRGAEGLVLDLRGNGGGLLQEAVLVASIFVEEGPIVTTEGRTRPRETLEATGDALDPRPTAVLTNGDTASAAEIVAAALQENDLATLVGTTTFGKGTFQEVIELDGGAALDLTVGEYLTADGSSILGDGVVPDLRAPDEDPADGDDTLDRGLHVVCEEIDGG
jgi:carboxyl-terminal processing protease